MSETEEKEPRTKVNRKLKLGIAFLSITIGCLIARPFWIEQQNVQHNEQYAYLDSIKIINPGEERLQFVFDHGFRLLTAEIIESVTGRELEINLAEIVLVFLLVIFNVTVNGARLRVHTVAGDELPAGKALENFTRIFHFGYIMGYSICFMVCTSDV